MNRLLPCPGCARHVRITEGECPFCKAELDFSSAPDLVLPKQRLGRAATFAFGATLVGATTLVACGETDDDKQGAGGAAGSNSGGKSATGGSTAQGGITGVGGGIGPVYGAPPGGNGG